ncbi:MAG: hypothetical protein JRF52_08840 [Deltaproteobacteria bacterium]|nr:hypothetical protein [Deltaproteobacteria bacterium]
METELIRLVEEEGPLTGAEILKATDNDLLLLWRSCKLSKHLAIRTIGRRYLRLDRRIEGFARLSPSILREFLTYSIIGLAEDHKALIQRANEINSHIEQITKAKSELAYTIISAVVDRFGNSDLIGRQACIIIAGDIVYNMAHDVPRPERSTGKLIKGSDMDIVVVVDDLFPKRLIERLDEIIYREKQDILMTPHLREEIDYIVKDMNRVREQMKFETFKHMVACKILQEGTLLYGSEDLFSTIKDMLRQEEVTEKLLAMEERARIFRMNAERDLLNKDPQKIRGEYQHLFYPTEESEEFE